MGTCDPADGPDRSAPVEIDEEDLPDDPIHRAWVLSSRTRRALYRALLDRPGMHLSGLSDVVGVHISTLDHHVRALEDRELAETRRGLGGHEKLCFLVDDVDLWDGEARTRVLFSAGDVKHVANYVVCYPACTVQDIATDLELHEDVVRVHLDKLLEWDLIHRGRMGSPYGHVAEPLLEAWRQEIGHVWGKPWEEGDDEVGCGDHGQTDPGDGPEGDGPGRRTGEDGRETDVNAEGSDREG